MANTKGVIDWTDAKPTMILKEDRDEIISYAKERNINVVDLSKFDGDKEFLKQEIDLLGSIMQEYPEATRRKITVTVGNLADDDFALTTNRTIILNANALRDKKITEDNIKKSGIFASPKPEQIIVHEFGHILSGVKGNKGIEITKKAYYNIYNKDISDLEAVLYLKNNVSKYSVKYGGDYEEDMKKGRVEATKYIEVTSEILAKDNYKKSVFTREYLRVLKEEQHEKL